MKTDSSSTWTEKHRPRCWTEVKGQDEAIKKIKTFLQEFYAGKTKKKATLLHGPPGTGKTTLAYVAGIETQSEIFELNASDIRNKEKLEEILKPALQQQSIIKKNKIFLIDEVDGISGYYDRGGLQELLSLISETPYPIIITANDIWDSKFSSLRKICNIIQLKEVDNKIIKEILNCLLSKENQIVDENTLTKISINVKGDLRAAINDIQSISQLSIEDKREITPDERNKEKSIFNILKEIFKNKPTNEMLKLLDSASVPLDEVFLWIEENIPTEYSGEELFRAYDLLSKADIFKGRIHKQQYWRFMVYENIFLSFGISTAKKFPKTTYTTYKKPTRILKIWMNNQRTLRQKSIAEKYAQKVHIGTKRAMHEYPIIKNIIKSNKEIQKELRLTEEEVEYVIK